MPMWPATPPCPRCKGCKRNGGCWRVCGKKAVYCAACDSRGGRKGACCRPGDGKDPIECQVAQRQFAEKDVHTCAVLPGDAAVYGALYGIAKRVDDLEQTLYALKKSSSPVFTPPPGA